MFERSRAFWAEALISSSPQTNLREAKLIRYVLLSPKAALDILPL